jgi:SAM-dependent methyltransferase
VSNFRPGSVDYERQAPAFDRGRSLSADATETWRAVAERWFGPLSPERVLDLGSGTGRLSPLLAEWLGCQVTGVEPSDGMREVAERDNAHPAVTYLAGNAGGIPLEDSSCDAAWMMNVIHHVPDRKACGRELARVVREGGRVLIFGAYTERRRDLRLFHYFPASLRVIDEFPLAEEIVADLEAAGLQHEGTEEVEYVSTPSIRAAVERTRLRADTTLQLITDEEFAAGMAKLEAKAAAETEPQPIMAWLDLIGFRR